VGLDTRHVTTKLDAGRGQRVRRKQPRVEEYVDVPERLRPYLDASTERESQRVPSGESDTEFLEILDLMERVVNLLTLMPPWSQRRETIEDLISPYDRVHGRRAVDALIEAAEVAEDETGHLYLLR
jgi:hypothetical protein